MNARDVKDALYGRHPASGGQMPGAWTVLEEWQGIDLLAFSAWSSVSSYARVGYEVKVSRSDLRRELLNPHKRSHNVAWCNEFYFAVPRGLLTPEEVAYQEPAWEPGDFMRAPCRYARGSADCPEPRTWPGPCHRGKRVVLFIGPLQQWRGGYLPGRPHVEVRCDGCEGRGYSAKSRAERDAPTLWVPRDVGLVEVDGRGCVLVKRSPRREQVPALARRELGQLVRWVSMRPDRRHQPA